LYRKPLDEGKTKLANLPSFVRRAIALSAELVPPDGTSHEVDVGELYPGAAQAEVNGHRDVVILEIQHLTRGR
jgi:hypothetical protein